jgi:amino acid transporter
LPSFLGRVHSKHKSPYVSALAVGITWAIATILFTVLGVAPEVLYPIASGSGTFAVLLLMFITSFAVLVYFVRRRGSAPESVWKTIIAPIISVLFLGAVTYLAIANYPELIGGSELLTIIFMTFTFALFFGGIVYAFFLRSKRPDIYARLGSKRID